MKRILNIATVISYYLLLASFCVLYGLSTVNEENKTMSFRDDTILISWGFFFLLVLVGLTDLIYHLVLYFKKRNVDEIEKEEDKELISYKGKEKGYLSYFWLEWMRNERDINFFSFHVVAFSFYAVLIYFQKNLENRMYYFYIVFLLGMVILLILLSIVFIAPLFKRKEEGKIEYEYHIYLDHLIRMKEDKEEILYFNDIKKMKENKTSFLIVTKDKQGYILQKDNLNEETQSHLHTILKEKKYDRLLMIKKQR